VADVMDRFGSSKIRDARDGGGVARYTGYTRSHRQSASDHYEIPIG